MNDDELKRAIRIAQAAVLRAAEAEQRAEAKTVPDTTVGTHADGHRCAADFLARRAAALEAVE